MTELTEGQRVRLAGLQLVPTNTSPHLVGGSEVYTYVVSGAETQATYTNLQKLIGEKINNRRIIGLETFCIEPQENMTVGIMLEGGCDG